uniref:BY PROTMAP: gi/472585677/gb/EMS23228.1/ MFS transporter [Rhodosporidium toruloides NP11] n=1 Tax=Rhodotorula toruloides TaxID=5286 RepID=A0A0K3CM60_RHOTO
MASPDKAATPSRPAARPATSAVSFRPLARTQSASSTLAWNNAHPPASGAHDLPEFAAMAGLERTTSQTSVRSVRSRSTYTGGAGMPGRGRSRSMRAPVVVGGKEGRIEEDSEAQVVDEEVAVGEHDEAVEETEEHANRMYARFSPRRKRAIVGIVAYAALLAPFSSSSFLPSIPQITEDLHTSAFVINVTVAIFILCIGIFPLVWAPYSGIYGRKPIYVISLPIFALGCLGTALSKSLSALIVTRIIQALGSSPVLSVGAGTIGDLYPKHERGTAMGLFYLGILVGPATAPAIAGILTEYVKPYGFGWRAMQYLLMSLGFSAFALVLICFPETAHAKGIDVVRQERLQERAEKEGVEVEGLEKEEQRKRAEMRWARRQWEGIAWVWLNPLAPLRLLLHPNIAAMSLNSSFTLSTLAPRYNITNAAILGCFYLAQGVGNATASRYTGRYADWTLKRWLKRRGGVYVPEDRLYAALIGGGVILPCSVLALGWVLDKGTGKVGLAFACVLTPSNTYCVDVMPLRSSEVIAVNKRNAIGVGWTNTFAAFVVWLGCGMVLLTIRFGPQMRAIGTKLEGTVSAGTDLEESQEKAGVEVQGSAESGVSTVVQQEATGREEEQPKEKPPEAGLRS